MDRDAARRAPALRPGRERAPARAGPPAHGRPPERLTLHVYPADGAWTSRLFEDAGDGYGFEHGEAYRCTFHGTGTADEVRVEAAVEGAYVPEWAAWEVVVHGLGRAPAAVASDGRPVAFEWDGAACRFSVAPSAGFRVRR